MLFLPAMLIRFRRFELDPETYRLTSAGRPVDLRPKAFDLLAHLVAHRDRVVPRDELVRVVWGHTNVGPGSLSGLVNELRTALGEPAGDAGSIRTVHARGYQFVAAVTEGWAEEGHGTVHRVGEDRPFVSVLRDALSQTLRRHGVTESQIVAGLLDRVCDLVGLPARPPMRRVGGARSPEIARLVSTGGSDREDDRPP